MLENDLISAQNLFHGIRHLIQFHIPFRGIRFEFRLRNSFQKKICNTIESIETIVK